jgi:hypothetical protein
VYLWKPGEIPYQGLIVSYSYLEVDFALPVILIWHHTGVAPNNPD